MELQRVDIWHFYDRHLYPWGRRSLLSQSTVLTVTCRTDGVHCINLILFTLLMGSDDVRATTGPLEQFEHAYTAYA